MIHIDHLKKSYDSFTLECSLDIPKGVITGIIGMNGAGKSTLFKSILGINPIDEGNIQIPDKQDIGVVLSETGFSEFFTVSDIISILKCTYKRFDEDLFRSYCQRFDISLDKKTRTFSTGMKAKLNIIIALTHHAQLLILDEPTAGLDPKERVRFRNILSVLSKDRIVILSTHIVSDIESIANHVIMIKEKHLLKNDTVPNICKELYGKVFERLVDESEIQEFEQKRIILSMRQESEKMMVRYYSEEEDNNARPCTPNLEDVFLVTYREEK